MQRSVVRISLAACLVFSTVLGAAGDARATRFRAVDVACPVCGEEFVALRVRSTNTFGGIDPDLCRHANGDSPLEFDYWTCPHCHYSRSAGEFAQAPSEQVRSWIRDELKSPLEIAPDASQRDIPGWVKLELTAAIRTREKCKGLKLAQVLLQGSYVTRMTSHVALQPVRDDDELDDHLAALDARYYDLIDTFSRLQPGTRNPGGRRLQAGTRIIEEAPAADGDALVRDLTVLYGASIVRQRGECRQAEPSLSRLARQKGVRASIQAAARALLESIERERSFQRRCVESLLSEVKSGLPASWRYALAELQRRLGDAEAAAKTLSAVVGDPKLPQAFRILAHEAANFSNSVGTAYAQVDAETWPAFTTRLVAALSDDEHCDACAEALELLGDRDTEPALLKALGHASVGAREGAAKALRGQPTLTAATLAALRARARDVKEDDDVREAAVETLAMRGDAGSLDLFRSLLKDDTWWMPELVIDGLITVGDESDVARIVRLREDYPDEVRRGLSMLTNQSKGSDAAFSSWWKQHKTERRNAWVRAGFGDRLPVADLTSRKNVPALIELLESEQAHLRLNAQRTLRQISGKNLGLARALSTGTYPMADPEEPYGVKQVLGAGEVMVHSPLLAFDPTQGDSYIAKVLTLPYAKGDWKRGADLWKQWWRTHRDDRR